MSNQTELKPCPCGKTPASINVVGEHDKPKYAYCYGDCCNAWEVEFRNDHAELHGNESNAKAVDAWNAAPRAFLAKIDAAKGDVPEGFVMVPVVMTDEMFNAVSYAIADDEPTLSIYNKLLAAKIDASKGEESEFQVISGADEDACIEAATSGPRDMALREAMRYAHQYAEDGPVKVVELVTVAMLAASGRQDGAR